MPSGRPGRIPALGLDSAYTGSGCPPTSAHPRSRLRSRPWCPLKSGRPGPTSVCSNSASVSSESRSRAARRSYGLPTCSTSSTRAASTFNPHFWLSAEWFSPDGVPGRGDPVLPRTSASREARTRADARGRRRHPGVVPARFCGTRRGTPSTTPTSCGSGGGVSRSSDRPTCSIRSTTRRNRTARVSCLHLDSWYAQSHPDEDFAETFAVWLNPQSDWRARYADWPALKKLEYMDSLMSEVAGKPMLVADTAAGRADPEHQEDTAGPLPAQAPALRRRAPALLRSGSAKAVLGSARARKQHEGRAFHRPGAAGGASNGRVMDRRISVHDRSGAREHGQARATR